MKEIILGKELSGELLELCKEYTVNLSNIKNKINENNFKNKEIENDMLKKQILVDKGKLNLLIKKDTNTHLFEQTIASLIFCKYKLAKS